MENLKTLTKLIESELEEHPNTRDDDYFLYYRICKELNPTLDLNMVSLADYLLRKRQLNLPAFDSVSRIRRKVQAGRTDLAADATVEAGRELREEKFVEYARTY